ncbi:MAG: AAA family ATPase [Candidatus ainarchaeum sp.]|nr:AAA family ATPase [Candidatus ainarchaeum sp.]
MTNVFSSKSENHIIKDERFLYPDFVPQRIPFREQEISEMVFCLKPSTQGKKPENIFISGPPGIGKTVTSKFVLNELEEYSDRVKCIYINCFELNSYNSIMAKLTNSAGYPVPMRGLSTEELFERFVAVIKSKRIVPVIVFDESEQLLKKEDTKKLLYDLSRLNDQFKIFAGLVFISNDNLFLSFLDERIRSSLNASVIKFEKYSCLQLKEILRDRAKFVFFDNVLDDDVIALCAAHASKTGDARIAIYYLLKSARIAEKENSKKVLIKHVRSSFQEEKIIKFEIMENLSDSEKKVLEIISKKELTSRDLYTILESQLAERTIRKIVSDLEQKGIIETIDLREGKFVTRVIKKKIN